MTASFDLVTDIQVNEEEHRGLLLCFDLQTNKTRTSDNMRDQNFMIRQMCGGIDCKFVVCETKLSATNYRGYSARKRIKRIEEAGRRVIFPKKMLFYWGYTGTEISNATICDYYATEYKVDLEVLLFACPGPATIFEGHSYGSSGGFGDFAARLSTSLPFKLDR